MQLNDLKKLLSLKFDLNIWNNLLNQLFPKVEFFTSPAKVTDSSVKTGGHIGNIRLDDGRSLAIFSFEVIDNILIARNRKGLREIAAKYIDQSLIHGALVFYYSANQDDYRLTFIAKQTFFNEKGELEKKETAPKRYTFLLGPNEPCTTAAKRLLELFDKKSKGSIYLADVIETFSVERLNKEFFTGYKAQYTKFIKQLPNSKHHRDYVKKLLGRLVFLQFLQKKGWMGVPASKTKWEGGDKEYLLHLIERNEGNNSLLSHVLEPLFFKTLNESRTNDLADGILGENIKIPYLNGGLFEEDELDKMRIDFSYDFFKELIHFFSQYNFTIDENDPDDSEVGIDPEMLGHIFENLLEDNKDKGAFYTPKEIVQYMSRQSIIQYLKTYITEEQYITAIDTLVNTYQVEPILQNKEIASCLTTLLQNVKVCDPAIGSGAFPMGIMNVLFHTRHTLHAFADKNGSWNAAQVKREIIQNNIFGVDIEQGAVDIARLRFWLALVVDADTPQPLPNLDYKITCGNSLLSRYAVDAPIENVFVEYNKDKSDEDKMSFAKYKQLVNDFTNSSDHAAKEKFRETIEAIKKAFKIELSNQFKLKLAKLRGRISTLEAPMLFGERAKSELTELKKLKIQLSKLEKEQDDILSNQLYANAFEWRFEFPQLLEDNGNFIGFDIVIGNPPYIDSETMEKTMPEYRNLYKQLYQTAKGNWDIYVPFIEQGNILLRIGGIQTYIVPNKLVSVKYTEALRLYISQQRPIVIRDYGSVPVFDADVYPCVFILQKKYYTTENNFTIFEKMQDLTNCKSHNGVSTNQIREDLYWDKFFVNTTDLTNVLSISRHSRLNEYVTNICGAATVSEAYDLKSYIFEYAETQDKILKFINTGTIDPYCVLWGKKKTQYIKNNYYQPIVRASQLQKYSSRRYEQSISKKIIVAGMSLNIEAFYDATGAYLAGKSTTLILGEESNLKYLLAILNSKLMGYYLRIVFNSLKMAGGYINFGVNELSQIPVASTTNQIKDLIGNLVDYIMFIKEYKENMSNMISNSIIEDYFNRLLNGCVYQLYFEEHMKELEIDIIDSALNFIKPISQITTKKDKSEIILDTFMTIKKTDNPIRNRLDLFSSRSPNILRTIIEG